MQELVLLLSTLTIDPTRKFYIYIGDITLMYTNINKDSYHNILNSISDSYYGSNFHSFLCLLFSLSLCSLSLFISFINP
jgi:hypothetical protein